MPSTTPPPPPPAGTVTIIRARPVEGNMAEPRGGEQGRAGNGEQIGSGLPDDWGDPPGACPTTQEQTRQVVTHGTR